MAPTTSLPPLPNQTSRQEVKTLAPLGRSPHPASSLSLCLSAPQMGCFLILWSLAKAEEKDFDLLPGVGSGMFLGPGSPQRTISSIALLYSPLKPPAPKFQALQHGSETALCVLRPL